MLARYFARLPVELIKASHSTQAGPSSGYADTISSVELLVQVYSPQLHLSSSTSTLVERYSTLTLCRMPVSQAAIFLVIFLVKAVFEVTEALFVPCRKPIEVHM